MYPIFHVALPLVFTEIPKIKNLRPNRLTLIIGTLLPDIIDKSLFLLGYGNGRLFSHNLLFVGISFLILFLFTKRNLRVSIPFLLGLIAHLFMDMPQVPLFYPFLSYEFGIIEEPFWWWIKNLFTNPLVITTEITGLVFLFFILIKNRLYHMRDILIYLKGEFSSIQLEQEFNRGSRK